MSIFVIGINHKTAPIELRERLAFNSKEALKRAISSLIEKYGFTEVVILSTCNRVEIYVYSSKSELTDSAEETLKKFLAEFHKIRIEDFERYIYRYRDRDAVEHLFTVTSSLDSMVVGEPQITGQVKEAYEIAQNERATSLIFNHLFKRAFFTAKRVRNETRIGENPVSISYAAVGLIKKVFDQLSEKSILLVGAGEMAELALKHLVGNGVKRVFLTNRTFERAEELAREFSATAVAFDSLVDYLQKVDIVLCSTAAPHYVITKEMLKEVMHQRRYKPLFMVDISVPRNIEPSCNDLDNVFLYDIDDLQEIVDSNLLERKKEAKKAIEIVREEVDKFEKWLNSLESVPTIVSIRNRAEKIRIEEFEKFKSRFSELPPEVLASVEYLTQSITNKIMHSPTVALKNSCENKEILIYAARKLFGLESDEE